MPSVEFVPSCDTKGFPELALARVTEDGEDEYWIVKRLMESEELFLLRKAVLVTYERRLMSMRVILAIQIVVMIWLCSSIIKAAGLDQVAPPEAEDDASDDPESYLRTICSVMVVIGAQSFIACFFLVAWEMVDGRRNP